MLSGRFFFHALFFLISSCFSFAQRIEKYDRFADSLIKIGQWEKCIPYFEKEIKLKPKNEEALRHLGFYYLKNGKPELAEKYYGLAVAVNPKCARCYLNMAIAAWTQNANDKALEYFNRSIALSDTDSYAIAERARFKSSMHDNFGAQMDLDRAIELAPKNAEFYIWRSDIQYEQGYFKLALSDLNKAGALAPNHYYTYFKKGVLYYENKLFKEALTELNTAIKLDSTQALPYAIKAAIYGMMNDHQGAVKLYDRSIQLNPGDAKIWYYRALDKYLLEDMDGACEDIFKSMEILRKTDPADPMLKELQFSVNDFCDSMRPDYYYQRGIANYNLNRFANGLEAYNKGLKKFPGHALLLSFRGNTYVELHEFKNALADYYQSVSNLKKLEADIRGSVRYEKASDDSVTNYINGIRVTTCFSTAKCNYTTGSYEKALEEINEGIRLASLYAPPNFPEYYNLRGLIYLALQNNDQAIKDFTKAIETDPGYDLPYVNRAVARTSQASGTRVKTAIVTLAVNGKNFNASHSFPANFKVKKSDDKMLLAMSDCNKAIEINPASAYGYYIRGQLKKALMHGDYCLDLIKAKDLGLPVEDYLIVPCIK
jgi:tetratricopeptide (TPR) repeat protein